MVNFRKMAQDGYRNLNKILRAASCSGFACYLQGLLSWKNRTQFFKTKKTAHFKAKKVNFN